MMKLMDEKGKQRIEQFFEARIYAQNFENLYKDVVAGKSLHLTDSFAWEEIILNIASNLGNIGNIVIERQIEDLRNFEQLFKDNFFTELLSDFTRTLKPLK